MALVNVVKDEYVRLALSCGASAFCTFWGTLGTCGLAHLAAGHGVSGSFAYAFFEASATMAAVVYFRWSKSPLAKNIPISVPIPVEAAERSVLQSQGIVTTGGK